MQHISDSRCANCGKEAQFYCCWNTSYCDYSCQIKQWSKHMSKCTQHAGQSQPGQSPAIRPQSQLTFRPAIAKAFGGVSNEIKIAYFKLHFVLHSRG